MRDRHRAVLGEQLDQRGTIRAEELDQEIECAIDLAIDLLGRDAREAGRKIDQQLLESVGLGHTHTRMLTAPQHGPLTKSRDLLPRCAPRNRRLLRESGLTRASWLSPEHYRAWHATRITAAVSLRITVVTDHAVRHIRVEGRLTGEEVGELDREIGLDPRAVCLELDNLRSADESALAMLRRLRDQSVEMRGVPPHLAWRIDEDGR